MPARFGVIALDEGLEDEFAPASLRDRLALHLDLNAIGVRDAEEFSADAGETAAARAKLPSLKPDVIQIEAVCAAASVRHSVVACAVTRAAYRLRQYRACGSLQSRDKDDLALAARLVLAPRARCFRQQEGSRPNPSSLHRRPKIRPKRPVVQIKRQPTIVPSTKSFWPLCRRQSRRMCWRHFARDLPDVRTVVPPARPAHCRNPATRPSGRRLARRIAWRVKAQRDRNLARGGAMAAFATPGGGWVGRESPARIPDPKG